MIGLMKSDELNIFLPANRALTVSRPFGDGEGLAHLCLGES